MFVRASMATSSGGGYDVIDVPALASGNTSSIGVPASTDCKVAVICPQSNGTYIQGGLFQVKNSSVTTLKTNNAGTVKLTKSGSNLAVNTSIATAAGKVLVAYD